MLKFFLPALLLIVISNSTIAQQSNRNKKQNEFGSGSVASLYPMQFILSTFRVGFEQRISDKMSLKGIGSFGINEHSYIYEVDNYTGFSVEGQLRYFPMHRAPSGMYGGLYFYDRGASFDKEQTLYDNNGYYYTVNTPYDLNAVGAGVLFGLQLFAGKMISFDFYGGGGPNIPLNNTAGKDLTDDFGGSLIYVNYKKSITFHGGISVGFLLR